VAILAAVGRLPLVDAEAYAAKGQMPLAKLYPGDEGIERDRRVLFAEDFESGTPEQIGARWGQVSRKAHE
jgi:hypothetical protein